jgi:hypothetical protein
MAPLHAPREFPIASLQAAARSCRYQAPTCGAAKRAGEIAMEVFVAATFLTVLTLAGLARAHILAPRPNTPIRRAAPVRSRIR